MRTGIFGVCLAAALTAAVAVTSSAAPSGADAQHHGPLHNLVMGHVGRLMTLHSELGLTAEQHEQFHKIVASHRQELLAVATPVHAKRRALCDAVLAEAPDEQAIRAAASDLGAAIGDAAVLGARIKAEAAGILTPEQREKIGAFRAEGDAAMEKFFDQAASGS
jgi:Spy/CpxP family protein refolding chaperone